MVRIDSKSLVHCFTQSHIINIFGKVTDMKIMASNKSKNVKQ